MLHFMLYFNFVSSPLLLLLLLLLVVLSVGLQTVSMYAQSVE